jgi:hypothetical protein
MKRELSNREAMDLMIEANRLKPQAILKLETSLKKDPDNLKSRIELLSYYFWKMHSIPVAKQYKRHLLWFLENAPENVILRFGPGEMTNYDVEIGKLWKKLVRKNPLNLQILENAATFFRIHAPRYCEKLLLKAKEIDSANSHWDRKLSHHYSLNDKKSKSVSFQKSAIEKEDDDATIFVYHIDLAKSAFEANDFKLAEESAKFVLKECKHHKGEWCYGNGIFYGNHVLGLLEMENGNIKKAISFLSKAGKTPGSPQLDSFGPSLELAQKLLDCGEKAAVISYLKDCQKFWKSKETKLTAKIKQIEAGKKVKLERFSL